MDRWIGGWMDGAQVGWLRPQGGGAARQIQLNQFKVLTAKSTVQTNRNAGGRGLKSKANTSLLLQLPCNLPPFLAQCY